MSLIDDTKPKKETKKADAKPKATTTKKKAVAAEAALETTTLLIENGDVTTSPALLAASVETIAAPQETPATPELEAAPILAEVAPVDANTAASDAVAISATAGDAPVVALETPAPASTKTKTAKVKAAPETKPTESAAPIASAPAAPAPTVTAPVAAATPKATVAAPAPAAPAVAASGTETASAAPAETEGEPEAEPEPGAGFRFLNLSAMVMKAVIEAGFEAPTPIQAQAIPVLLEGRDLIGQAQTGTGKTAAFALPLAEKLDPTQNYPQAIILLPTRELCIQVAQETHNLSKYRRLRVVPVYGGQPIDRQFRALMGGPQIIVGTPGRVLDHLRRGTLKLNQVRIVVLDEADEMLNMGFLEDVEEILKEAPKERQTALFSATMPPRIAALARDYLNNPQRVSIESKRRTVAQVEQTYYEVVPSQKVEALARILDMESPGSTIIFCRTRREVDELGESLQMRGYEAETLHGDMNQTARDRVMNRFRNNQAELLIATDVAARGLDIDQVTHVINYDIPWDVESYIHRIGRTGRAGRSGNAITLVSPRERFQLRLIERTINAPIRPARVPTAADIAARRREMFKENLRETLGKDGYDGFLMTVEELTEEGKHDSSQIAAAALYMLWQAQKGAADYDIAEADAEGERAETGMSRLFLQIGRQDGIRPGDIVGAIANEAGVPGNAIGAIDIMDRSTFVEVPEAEAQRVLEALNRSKLRGKRVYADIARPRREDDGFATRTDDRDGRGGDREHGGRDFRDDRGGFGRDRGGSGPGYGGNGGGNRPPFGRDDRKPGGPRFGGGGRPEPEFRPRRK